MNIGIFSGHLTADATFTPGTDQSKNRAKFKLAVSDSYDKNLVSFYTCIAFGPKANYIGNGLQKGRFLKGCEARVEGRLNTKDFTDQNGVKHTYQELTINEVEGSVHKNWSEGQDQQYVPNSGNNQDQQSYTGSVAPAGRSQVGPDEYSYGTPQGNGQNNQGQRSYAGSAAPAGRSQGNGQNQRFNEPQRSQNNQGQRSYNGSAAPAGRSQAFHGCLGKTRRQDTRASDSKNRGCCGWRRDSTSCPGTSVHSGTCSRSPSSVRQTAL